MNSEQYSLTHLRDIVLPNAPGLWPPAPGVLIVLAIVAIVVLIICLQWLSLYKRNAYRRAGLLLLNQVKTDYDISVLLKRVALAAFPREQVASLYGRDWMIFLKQSCPDSRFSEIDVSISSDKANNDLIKQAGFWIRHHRVPDTEIHHKNLAP